jgi:hypothetical protein
MTSEENVPAATGRNETAGPAKRDGRAPRYQVNDPAAMRALAHPLRWVLLEALEHAGTLTATQAGEILGETPANCAFHLRTLARYGLVEEAGGGKGRERPWRRAISGIDMTTVHDDPKTAAAAEVLTEFVMNETLNRARSELLGRPTLPDDLQNDLGSSQNLRYVTPAEARQLQADLTALLDRYRERGDDPALRPPGALPIEWLLLSYPLRDLLNRPAPAPEAEPDPDSESD